MALSRSVDAGDHGGQSAGVKQLCLLGDEGVAHRPGNVGRRRTTREAAGAERSPSSGAALWRAKAAMLIFEGFGAVPH